MQLYKNIVLAINHEREIGFGSSWKISNIIPVPNISGAKLMKDFRPTALTSILAKCMERIVCNHLSSCVEDSLDPLQFAYRARRGVEDATLSFLKQYYHSS